MGNINYRKRGMVLFFLLMVIAVFCPAPVRAQEGRTVKVAFFPMEGYHMYSEADGYGGMDAAYLETLCGYTGWNIGYVVWSCKKLCPQKGTAGVFEPKRNQGAASERI